jgi:hypothetical protein
MKLEDQKRDLALLSTEMEEFFKKHYLANLKGSPPFVCLESEDFINKLSWIMLIVSCRNAQAWPTLYAPSGKDRRCTFWKRRFPHVVISTEGQYGAEYNTSHQMVSSFCAVGRELAEHTLITGPFLQLNKDVGTQ